MRLAILQRAPVYLNLPASLERLAAAMVEAAQAQADLLVCGETWLTGYPAWLDHCPEIALWNHAATKKVYARMWQEAVEVTEEALAGLQAQARQHGMGLVLGINERVSTGPGNRSLYNSLLIIGPDGRLLNHHRKLMPTYNEKLLYALGDGEGLRSVELAGIRLGGLICWEHWMPLARQAMHNAGEHLHIALWPTVNDLHQLASRHYALEGRCFVLAVGQMMRAGDIPPELSPPPALTEAPEQWLLKGGSCLIAPDGSFVLPPQWEVEGLFFQDISFEQVLEESLALDASGHYQRPDVFAFTLKRQPRGRPGSHEPG